MNPLSSFFRQLSQKLQSFTAANLFVLADRLANRPVIPRTSPYFGLCIPCSGLSLPGTHIIFWLSFVM